jgi:CRISPR-associated protein Csb2
MQSYLSVSATFLAPTYHGRRDGGEPEWPPSPLRLFQALVAAAAARWRGSEFTHGPMAALKWLEQQPPPTIIAPRGRTGQPLRLSVPNNAMDIVARAWCRGNDSGKGDANPATHRALKTVRPTHLIGGETVYFLWTLAAPVPVELRGHVDTLASAARSLVALGWGIDLVAGHGRIISDDEISSLSGERWSPTPAASPDGLRVPTRGTFEALTGQHAAFLSRLAHGGFTPVPALSVFKTICYRRDSEPEPRPYAAFQLLTPDARGFQPYDSAQRTHVVAGMLRGATAKAARAAGWTEERLARFVLGHGDGPQGQAHGDDRFAYLPLPSLEVRGKKGNSPSPVVTDIRRVLLVEMPTGVGEATRWAKRGLSGNDLTPEAGDGITRPALLALLPDNDRHLTPYVRPSSVWSTVTPVLLPGYDDPGHLRNRLRRTETPVAAEEKRHLLERLATRIEELLRKAMIQAGYPQCLATHASLQWRNVGFHRGVELASRFRVPQHLKKFPRYHVRIHWRDTTGAAVEVPGPICLGAGRFYGLGLFVSETGDR